MTSALLCAAALLGGAAAGVVDTFGHASSMAEDAPEWCKNETELTWKQRKQRMEQHATLQWAKKMVKQYRETDGENASIPEWMDKIVSDDENKGRLKWAVTESKRLKAEGKETPEWMMALVKEDERWANRWAACKAHELKATNEEVPAWMVDNARKGIMEYASEKAAEIQEQIQEVETEKEKDEALVQANGDIEEANQKLIFKAKQAKKMTVATQLNVLEEAMLEFNEREEESKEGTIRFNKVKMAGVKAQQATEAMSTLLEKKLAMLDSHMNMAARYGESR
jgi:hypothetical protein